MDQCVVCGNVLHAGGGASWHVFCPECGYEGSRFSPFINDSAAHGAIDENLRKAGLHSIRVNNFKTLIKEIKKFNLSDNPSLLDVGAAHGWFLDLAKRDFRVLGIEPDEAVAAIAIKENKPIRIGYFPDSMKEDEVFDVIVFNDVIEHIRNIESVLNECHARLNADGLLLINLPSSKGFFYRISKILNKFFIKQFFERLWQMGMPSPHIHYFDPENLKRMVCRFGFAEIHRGTLPALQIQGLYTRISYSKNINIINRIIIFSGVALLLPFLSILPKDIMYGIYRRT